ncbi:ATP synthase F1 subunit delta [Candidatus Chloroploca asiatica]|uniref:ATP synthase subunit delta n=1 Tax=Candidatus Chloroploca asiatica TaxID=1506545 RepID=A0A2H3L8S5_9CHLR|nr:ATP synthase F1 subunit delta [Candidatus Chloroploca asiatica]PDV98706.1 ATP synthase F1 subunit delta [Candidatus Chloroploca asiatica]
MATTVDARAIASTLYDALIGTAVEQLQLAAPKLAKVSDGELAKQIDAALPPQALPQVRNFLLGLAREGLLGQLDDIVTAFTAFASGAPEAALDAVVTSAVELSSAQQAKILAELKERYGTGVVVSFAVDPTLIGGLIIRVGDQVLDNSLRTRLSVLQRSMLAG